tara:strand:+ start:2001 stop:2738 length:738 start_codon:yes stop_codon:yes gene_type:complete
MFFTNLTRQKLIIMAGFIFLLGCAAKQPVIESDPLLESARLQAQNEEEQFKRALSLIKTEHADEKKLLKAKGIFDALYDGNSAYLGALINSADISLKLEKLDESKALYLDALTQIERQLNGRIVDNVNSGNVVADTAAGKDTVGISDNIKLFQIHTYNQLGLIERQQGQFDQAEAFYKHALELDARNVATIKNLAILLDLYRGQLAEALVLYEQYQSMAGDSDPKVKDWIYDLKNRLPAEETNNE